MELGPAPRWNLSSGIVAIAVLLAGFGVLNLLYWPIRDSVPEPGLYGYLSSSIGDAVLLPVAAFFLTRANLRVPRPRRVIPALFGLATGLAAGVILQASWLADPEPNLNWTLVAPGTFNAAGWYHAVLLTVMSGLFAMLVLRAIGLPAHGERAGVLMDVALAVFALGVFAVLLVLDNAGAANRASIATLVALALAGAAVIGVILVLVLRRRSRKLSR